MPEKRYSQCGRLWLASDTLVGTIGVFGIRRSLFFMMFDDERDSDKEGLHEGAIDEVLEETDDEDEDVVTPEGEDEERYE